MPAHAVPRHVDAAVSAALSRGEAQRVIVELKYDDGTPDIKAVRRRRDMLKAAVIAALSAERASFQRRYTVMPLLALAQALTLKHSDALQDDDRVEAVYPDLQRKAIGAQALPLIGQPAAVSAGYPGAGAAVAVLDTGVDYTLATFSTGIVLASLPGNDNWLAVTPFRVSFALTAATASNPNDDDVPLPAWALVGLAAALAGSVMRIRR